MELIYAMRRKPLKCEPPQFERASDPAVVRPICTISSGNIIAFSSPTELTDADGDTWGGHVYVCDLDTPWDCHKVVSTTHSVSTLEWDIEGKQLLVGTTEGEVSVFGQKDYLLNEWICLYTMNFPGEHIIKAVFFHNGRRVVAVDKKHDAPITDKVQTLRCTPTLKGFGGVAISGACVVSASGLVGVWGEGGVGPGGGGRAPARDSLSAHRDRVVCADIAHKNGNLLIAGICRPRSGGACVIRCALSAVRGGGAAPPAPAAPLSAHAQPLPALVCPHPAGAPPTAISWCLREDTDSLLVAGATLTLWKLSERQHVIHKQLSKAQGSTTPGGGQKATADCFNTVVWQQTGAWCVDGGTARCESVASAKLPLTAPHIVLAAHKKIHLLNRDSHHYVSSRVVSIPEPIAASPPKKAKYGNGALTVGSGCTIVSCVELSVLGGVAVAIDTRAQLHVFTLPQPCADIPTPLSVQHATTILEYSMVSGFDSLDILLTLKPNIVEAVYERLTETFQRQPAPFQQYYYHSWLKMRMALCRMIPNAASSVSWLSCLSTLWATWASVGAALRPDASPDDKPLAALLDEQHKDHEKAVVALEAKAELAGELQAAALRRPLQRAVDIALTALASLTHPSHPYELWTDPAALSLLRKLVVIARGVGLGDSAISRLLARLHHPLKPDLVEECVSLGMQMPARVWEALPRTAISAPHAAPFPVYLDYLVEPERLKSSPEPPPPLADCVPTISMDSIRYMYLGATCRWRRCARCGARALPPPAPAPAPAPARHPLQRAHDARFLPACRCGGRWTLVTNI